MSASQILGEIEKLEIELLNCSCPATCQKIKDKVEILENIK